MGSIRYTKFIKSFIFSCLTLALLSNSLYAKAGIKRLQIPAGNRTIRVVGEISGDALITANKIERLSAASTDPIYIVINSPGGGVFAGLQLIQAIEIAKNRGTKVVCAVGNLAASMAFQILPHCSERYALPNSLLLFHPARVFITFGAITAEQATMLGREMAKLDKRSLNDLSKMIIGKPFDLLSVNTKNWLLLHFYQETMWVASDIVNETNDNWLKIVDVIDAPDGIFKLNDDREEPKNKLKVVKEAIRQKLPYVIVNQK